MTPFGNNSRETTGPFGSQDEVTSGPFGSQEPIEGTSEEVQVSNGSLDEIIESFRSSGNFRLLGYADYLEELKRGLNQENLSNLSTILNKFSTARNNEEITQIMEELQQATRAFQEQMEQTRQETAEQEQIARNENLKALLEEARSLELRGHIETSSWSEVMVILEEQLGDLRIDISEDELRRFEAIFNAMKQNADGIEVSLQATDSILDSILDQAEEHNDNTPFTVRITQNNIAQEAWETSLTFLSDFSFGYIPSPESNSFEMEFPSSETAIQFVVEMKNALKSIENINFNDWVTDILLDSLVYTAEGIWAIDQAVFDIIAADVEFTFTNGSLVMLGSLGAHALGYYILKTRLDAANSGVRPENIDAMTDHLRETIRIYRSAGFDSEEIANMEKLLRDLTEFFPETPDGINDQRFRARYVYSVLQRWRGSTPMDTLRFGASGIGRIFDTDIWSRDSYIRRIPFVGEPIMQFPIVRRLGGLIDFGIKVHLLPITLGSKLINKGPDGWGLFNTKSGVINSYSDALKNANETFTRFFAIIDSISELPSAERTALKREILELYGRYRPDPLAETRLGIASGDESIIRRIGRVNLDREAALIISQAIEDKLGYVPEHLTQTFEGLRRRGDEFEAERSNIENARQQFLRFVEYYPGLSEEQESALKSISTAEGLTSENAESFNRQMIRILKDVFSIDVTAQYIKDFGDMVEHESINTGENRVNARILERIDDILLEMRNNNTISPQDSGAISDTAQTFFRGNKTFWQAHLGVIVRQIINGETPTGVSSLDEVNQFINNGGSRDIFTELRNILRNIGSVTPDTGGERVITTDDDERGTTEETETRGEEVPEELNTKPGIEYLGRNSNWGRGYEVFKLEILMRSEVDLDPDVFFADILTREYASREEVFEAMNQKLSSEGIDIQISQVTQSEELNFKRAYAEDVYTRYVMSTAGSSQVNEMTLNSIRTSANPLGLLDSIDISSVPSWDDITISGDGIEEILDGLREVRSGAWRTDGGVAWRTFLGNLRKAAT